MERRKATRRSLICRRPLAALGLCGIAVHLSSKWPSISERRSPTEMVTNRVDLDRTERPANGLIKLTIQIPNNWMPQTRATSLGTEMAALVAVDLRATQPDRNGIQSY